MIKTVTTAAVLLLAAGFAQAGGDVEAGKAKSATCAGCHGADGNSVNPAWPSLAGQHAAYLEKQLKNFKVGQRKDPTMSAMAAALSEADMQNLAAYFSSQTRKGGEADPKAVELGEKIYRGGNSSTGLSACTACHGPTGAGIPQAGFPALGGQHATYVAKALKDFRSGARDNDINAMMRDVASRLSDAEIDAVAQYVQGLH